MWIVYVHVYPACLQVDPVSDWRLFCKAHAHASVVERLGHATELEVCIHVIHVHVHVHVVYMYVTHIHYTV